MFMAWLPPSLCSRPAPRPSSTSLTDSLVCEGFSVAVQAGQPAGRYEPPCLLCSRFSLPYFSGQFGSLFYVERLSKLSACSGACCKLARLTSRKLATCQKKANTCARLNFLLKL